MGAEPPSANNSTELVPRFTSRNEWNVVRSIGAVTMFWLSQVIKATRCGPKPTKIHLPASRMSNGQDLVIGILDHLAASVATGGFLGQDLVTWAAIDSSGTIYTDSVAIGISDRVVSTVDNHVRPAVVTLAHRLLTIPAVLFNS
jgi:hypothetical protein